MMKMPIEIAKLHVLVLAVLSVQDKTSPLDRETLGSLLEGSDYAYVNMAKS